MKIFNKNIKKDIEFTLRNPEARRERRDVRDDNYAFRRSRTLTGSTSKKIKSSGENHQLVSPRTELRNLQKKRRKSVGGLISSILILAGLSFLLYHFVGGVNVNVSNAKVATPTDKYAASIQKYLTSHPLERFRFNLDKDQLLSNVQEEFSEVESIVDIRESGIGEADFTVKVRTPVAGWSAKDKQYFVDEKGVSFNNNYTVEPSVTIDDQSGVDVNSGSAVVSNRFLGYVGRVVAEFKLNGHEVTKVVIPYATTRQMNVQVANKENLDIKMTVDRNVGEQVEDAARMLDFIDNGGKNPSYIDVRIKGKAYYR